MSNRLNYLLIADGSSDKALQYIINWLIQDLRPDLIFNGNVNYQNLSNDQSMSPLAQKIHTSLKLYPNPNILFVHRDAENTPANERLEEIKNAIDELNNKSPYVCVVPVRMMEAWILFSEDAIRQASGNPNGKISLPIPSPTKVEQIPDPKDQLFILLRRASELRGRRLKRLNVYQGVHRVAELIEDYSPLRALSAFQTFENDLKDVLDQMSI